MSKDQPKDREYFIRLMLTLAEESSDSEQKAKSYLQSEGIDPDKITDEGLIEIKRIQQKLDATKRQVAKKQPVYRRWHHPSVLRLLEETGANDPLEAIKSKARDQVMQAFERGWQGPPYSPVELAQFIGIKVTPQDSVTDARILPTEDGFEIEYNPFQKPTRINFSISHEIAHTLFSDCAQAIRNREQQPIENRQLEILCNAAAAEIQLPYAIFSHDANNAAPSIEGLIDLATRYRASLESVFLRYIEVIDLPCAILIGIFQSSDKIIIEYHKASRSFPFTLAENMQIPSSSKIYECVSPGWTSRETANWSVFADKNYSAFAVGISPYRMDNKPRVGILLLPNERIVVPPDQGKIVLEFGDATKPRGKGKMIIGQVVNTGAALGRGFGLSLAKNYPVIKQKLEDWKKDKSSFVLGATQLIKISEHLYVFQMLAQKGVIPKPDEVLLKYPELRKCLIELRHKAKELKASIHMNAIGSGQAGGDWNIIIGMIHDELVNHNIKVSIYLLPGKPINTKQRSTLTVFKEESTWETGKLF